MPKRKPWEKARVCCNTQNRIFAGFLDKMMMNLLPGDGNEARGFEVTCQLCNLPSLGFLVQRGHHLSHRPVWEGNEKRSPHSTTLESTEPNANRIAVIVNDNIRQHSWLAVNSTALAIKITNMYSEKEEAWKESEKMWYGFIRTSLFF